jgi:hypothetical protein
MNAAVAEFFDESRGRPPTRRRAFGRWTTVPQRSVEMTFPCDFADTAANPGEKITPAALERSRVMDRLKILVLRFIAEGISWQAGRATKITVSTAESAIALLPLLPNDVPIPKIAPDGEGGLNIVWEDNGNIVLLIVDNYILHTVKHAGTCSAVCEENIAFDRQSLPKELLSFLDK